MAATTKLIVYNEALRELGAAPLADLVTTNKSKLTLDTAFEQAVEYVLSKEDWNFARRVALLPTVANTGFPPYTVSYTKPADYLRKVSLKRSADDEFQTEHAEIASVMYGHVNNPILLYISDTSANYDPANWPPHFTRIMVVYLALLCAEPLARAGDDVLKGLWKKLEEAEATAKTMEVVFTAGTVTPVAREPVFRRAIEMMGQVLAGGQMVQSQVDRLKWHMNKAWAHSVRSVIEMGAWNFATRRATLTGGAEPVPGGTYDGLEEGYTLPPAEAEAATDLPDMAGYDYGYILPNGFAHKIWLKPNATQREECAHQIMKGRIYCNYQPVVLEYVAEDDDSVDPANWSAVFIDVVAAHLAHAVASAYVVEAGGRGGSVKADQLRPRLWENFQEKLSTARNKDAIQQYPQALPSGSFVRARMGSALSRLN